MEEGKLGSGSLANEGTSLRGMDNNFLFLCVLQVTLAYEKYSAIYVLAYKTCPSD